MSFILLKSSPLTCFETCDFTCSKANVMLFTSERIFFFFSALKNHQLWFPCTHVHMTSVDCTSKAFECQYKILHLYSNSTGSLFFFLLFLEMGTRMLETILQTKCMVLGCINLLMDIGMREPGTRVKGKGLGCTRSEMERLNQDTGKMEFLTYLAPRTQPTLYLLSLFIIPKYSMQCRY